MFEKVNPCHPDKVADRIAGAIVDLCYTKSKNPKVACEVLIGHSLATVIIETSEDIANHEVETIVRRIAGNVSIQTIADQQDPHLAANQQGAIRCGDNGIFRGSAPTHEQKMLTAIAASIYQQHPTDGKYIIKGSGRLASPVFDLTVCQSHMSREQEPDLRKHLSEAYGINGDIIINPLGEWTGGPDVDCGATNRKLGSDMGDGVTGGGLHGKDLSKADVSVNIWCYLESIRTGHQVEACCSIGDETVNGIPYADIVEQARLYIHTLGGFEKFAEWGLIRPDRAQ